MRSSNRRYLPRLDILRAVAAWWVVMHHCFTMIPTAMLSETAWTGSLNPLPVVATAAWWAITLFLVVSGFSIGMGLRDHRILWSGFLAARWLRIAPLYLVLLVLGIVTGARTMAQISGVPVDPLRSLLESVSMLPFAKAWTPFPWLATAWSVRIEAALYLFVPLLIWLARRLRPALCVPAVLTGCVLLIALGMRLTDDARAVLYAGVPGRLLEFSAGLLIAYYLTGRVPRSIARVCGWCGILGFLVMSVVSNRLGGEHVINGEPRVLFFMGSLLASLCLLLWAASDRRDPRGWLAAAGVRLGQWSYSTYMWHFTIMTFIGIPVTVYVNRAFGLSLWPRLLLGTTVTAVVTAAVSYASFRWIESPFLRLRPRYVRPQSSQPVSPQLHNQ